MGFYETIFIARQDLSNNQVDALTEKFVTILKENGGTVERTEYAGLKTLAYEIKKNRKGHYVLLNITAEPATIRELERVMRINEDLLRFLTVRVEEHEKGLSALSKSSRSHHDEEGDDNRRSDASSGSRENTSYGEKRYNNNSNTSEGKEEANV